MFTSRGYRQHSKENRKKSQSGQIIQRKPVFQIDNNPVVLDAYKQFILSTMPRLLKTQLGNDTHEITLSEFTLTWNQNTTIDDIQDALRTFTVDIFNQYESQGKYPISLELSSPNLSDSNSWVTTSTWNNGSYSFYKSIIIDRMGNLSYTQYGNGFLDYAYGEYSSSESNLTLAYGPQQSTQPSISYGNPTKMKVDVYFLTFYNGN